MFSERNTLHEYKANIRETFGWRKKHRGILFLHLSRCLSTSWPQPKTKACKSSNSNILVCLFGFSFLFLFAFCLCLFVCNLLLFDQFHHKSPCEPTTNHLLTNDDAFHVSVCVWECVRMRTCVLMEENRQNISTKHIHEKQTCKQLAHSNNMLNTTHQNLTTNTNVTHMRAHSAKR